MLNCIGAWHDTLLVLNGMEISASVDEQEHIILTLAFGNSGRESFVEWLRQHITASEQ